MCRLFPCIPILKVFIFLKKVSCDEGSRFYHVSCPRQQQKTLLVQRRQSHSGFHLHVFDLKDSKDELILTVSGLCSRF